MSAPKLQSEHIASEPWTPPEGDVEWFGDPAKRRGYITQMERHSEALFLEALAWLHMWRAEIAADAEDAA